MHFRSQALPVLLVAIAGIVFHGLAQGQAPVAGPATDTVAPPTRITTPAPAATAAGDTAVSAIIAELEAKNQAIEGDASLEEAVRAQAAQSYGQAIASYQELSRITAERERFLARVAAAPERITTLKANPPPTVLVPPAAPAAEVATETLQQQLRDAEAALESAKRALSDQESALAALQKSAASLGADVADRRARVEKLRSELGAPVDLGLGVSPRVQEARIVALSARKALREAEIEFYQRQLGSQDLLTELATLEREVAVAAVAGAQATADAIRAFVQSRREAEAELARTQAEAAKESAARLPAPIAELAAQNVALSTELEYITKNGATSAEELKAIEARSSEISSDFAATRQRVEVVGSTAAIGRMLRRRHVNLPSLKGFRRAANVRHREINGATDRQIDLDEQLRGLRDPEAIADTVLASLAAGPPARETVTREQVRELLTAQRDTIARLQKAYGRYVTDITALDVAERELVLAADGFLDFIDEQLIWIQSIPPLSLADLGFAPVAVRWLLAPSAWVHALKDLLNAVRDKPVLALLCIAAVVVVFLVRRASRDRLRALSDETRRIRSDRLSLTLSALAYTAAAAGAWPLLLVVLAWHLAASPTADAFTLSVSAGLAAAAVFVFTLDSVRRMCRPHGLGDRHFRWPEAVRAQAGSALQRFIVFGTPLVFVIAMTTEFAEPGYMRGLGRPVFVAFMLVLALFVNRLFGKTSPFVAQFGGRDTPNRVTQLHFLWFPALVAVPVVMALMSLLGYHHSALAIEDQVRETAWLAVALLVVREVILRMLYVAERRLRFEDAVRRREETRAQRERQEPEAVETAPLELLSVEEPEVDYHDLGDQVRRIVNTSLLIAAVGGLWAIWNELFPALGILNNVTLPIAHS